MRRLLLTLLLFVLGLPTGAVAAPGQESLFQDDDLLIYGDDATTTATLDELAGLGVDRLRITMVWRAIAPGNEQDTKPSGFDGADPAKYPPGAWDRWDRVVRLARERSMDVTFNVSTPAPDWATGTPARADIDETYTPSAEEFGAFVRAAGRRFDGARGPRVTSWSIQNEPNQAGWLTPQWAPGPDGKLVEAAPRMYRDMLRAAWTALTESGHGADTILIGETASKGLGTTRGETRAIDALRFVRRLYCVDDNNQLLRGPAAAAQGCPADASRFADENPALFSASGWAHHPYEPLFAPDTRPTRRDWATMANLDDLSDLLRRMHLRHGRPATARVPLHLTEFGYQTRPPDPRGVSLAEQAAWTNHAEWIAWRDSRVRSFAQFLLRDGGEPVGRTFQTGLRTVAGARKPSWAAYRFPIHVPARSVRRGQRVQVWGLPRPAPDGSRPRVEVLFRASGARRFTRIATVRGDARRGHVSARVRVPRSGAVRLRWNGIASRAVPVRVR